MNRGFGWLLAAALFSPISTSRACPFCPGDSAGENPVRRAIFDQEFGFHLGAMAVPFVLAGAAVPILSALFGFRGNNPRDDNRRSTMQETCCE